MLELSTIERSFHFILADLIYTHFPKIFPMGFPCFSLERLSPQAFSLVYCLHPIRLCLLQ